MSVKHKLSFFIVEYDNNKYFTLVDDYDREELAVVFDRYEQTNTMLYSGPEDWIVDVLSYFYDKFDTYSVGQTEGLPLYRRHHMNELWIQLKEELEEINEACRHVLL